MHLFAKYVIQMENITAQPPGRPSQVPPMVPSKRPSNPVALLPPKIKYAEPELRTPVVTEEIAKPPPPQDEYAAPQDPITPQADVK